MNFSGKWTCSDLVFYITSLCEAWLVKLICFLVCVVTGCWWSKSHLLFVFASQCSARGGHMLECWCTEQARVDTPDSWEAFWVWFWIIGKNYSRAPERAWRESNLQVCDMWQPASVRHLVTILSLATHTEMLASISGISLLVWDCLLAFLQMGCW